MGFITIVVESALSGIFAYSLHLEGNPREEYCWWQPPSQCRCSRVWLFSLYSHLPNWLWKNWNCWKSLCHLKLVVLCDEWDGFLPGDRVVVWPLLHRLQGRLPLEPKPSLPTCCKDKLIMTFWLPVRPYLQIWKKRAVKEKMFETGNVPDCLSISLRRVTVVVLAKGQSRVDLCALLE